MKKFFSLLLIISFCFVGNVYAIDTGSTGGTNAVVDWAFAAMSDTNETISDYTNMASAGTDLIVGDFASNAGNAYGLSIVVSSTNTFNLRHSDYANFTSKTNAQLAYTVDLISAKFESNSAAYSDTITLTLTSS